MLKFQSLSPRRLSPTGLSRISYGKVVPLLALGRREAPKALRPPRAQRSWALGYNENKKFIFVGLAAGAELRV